MTGLPRRQKLDSQPMTETAPQTSQDRSTEPYVIRVDNVAKLFRTPGEGTIGALQDISVDIGHSEFVTVVGPERLRQVDSAQTHRGIFRAIGGAHSLPGRRGPRP